METLQPAITDRGDTGHFKKTPEDERKQYIGKEIDESNYVDLGDLRDMRSDNTKTVKITFTGEGNQLAIIKCKSDKSSSGDKSPRNREEDTNVAQILSKTCQGELSKDVEKYYSPHVSGQQAPPPDRSDKDGDTFSDDGKFETDPIIENLIDDDHGPSLSGETEELQYTDMYLNSRCESEDDTSVAVSDQSAADDTGVVVSDQCVVDNSADESHYITTHEIQLTELDHDVDYEIGRGSCWDFEDDNLVYSFVDYASFESEDLAELARITERRDPGKYRSKKAQSGVSVSRAPPVATDSTEQESDLCDSDKCASSDESVSKHPNESPSSAGKIHLSIKTSSRAIQDSNNATENENVCYHARHVGERSHYFFKSTDARGEAVFDRAHYFIPAPGRQHLASKLKGKDINEYSSGASSSVSELDDADKEVRNLTARSFRSLACPYFDAINLSTSSESSVSEHGLGINKWSAFVDFNYGSLTRGQDQNRLAHKSSTSTFEVKESTNHKNTIGKPMSNLRGQQTKIFALKKKPTRMSSHPESATSNQIEFRGQLDSASSETVTLTKTLNFSCNMDTGLPVVSGHARCLENTKESCSSDEVAGVTVTAKAGVEDADSHAETGEAGEDTHKKAIFASSLLKNVISKKMRFEQERKMERGEIRDPHPVSSPSSQATEQEAPRERATDRATDRALQRQTSDASSGFSLISLEELGDAVESGPGSCDAESREAPPSPAVEPTELTSEPGTVSKLDGADAKKGPLPHSENSAFKSWQEGEEEVRREPQDEAVTESVAEASPAGAGEAGDNASGGVSNKQTKMSHLYVPSSQLLPKEKAATEASLHNSSTGCGLTGPGEGGGGNPNAGDPPSVVETSNELQGAKVPEIQIRVRSVRETKRSPFNMASLRTPNVGYNANALKTGSEVKSHLLSASDRVPNFMVRDIRDNKYKLQTPIHQVRDVRKLVKSSYRFVSLENTEGRAAGSSACALREDSRAVKKEPDKRPFPAPMVIKCQSVNTNSVAKHRHVEGVPDAARPSPKQAAESAKNLVHRVGGRTPCAQQPVADQSELQLKIEAKSAKQRPEKATDGSERKSECKATNQAALERLQAAVRSMEQLYVFDRNEWKRKTQAPRPVTDSHVLSLITSEERVSAPQPELEEEADKAADSDKCSSPQITTENPTSASANAPSLAFTEDASSKRRPPGQEKTPKPVPKLLPQAGTYNNKCVLNLGTNPRAVGSPAQEGGSPHNISTSSHTTSVTSYSASKCNKAPLSLKISKAKLGSEGRPQPKSSQSGSLPPPSKPTPAESENYLTIPVKACASEPKPAPTGTKATVIAPPLNTAEEAGGRQETSQLPLQSPPVLVDTWCPDSPTMATIYHHPLAMQAVQPQVICLSPPVVPAPVPAADPHQQTQKKMLVDPTTGQYYLVDAPLHPATRRLYDPESGQYVDVPLPAAVTPPAHPLTPVPLSVSPLAISPGGGYAPTYMIYPGLLPSPAVHYHSHSSSLCSGEGGAYLTPHAAEGGAHLTPHAAEGGAYLTPHTAEGGAYLTPHAAEGGAYLTPHAAERGAYLAPHAAEGGAYLTPHAAEGGAYLTPPAAEGGAYLTPHAAEGGAYLTPHTAAVPPAPPATAGGPARTSPGKPVISITSQQGPRIIAPPSFDGTTMSFVVEHR